MVYCLARILLFVFLCVAVQGKGHPHHAGGLPKLIKKTGTMLSGNIDIAIMWYGPVPVPLKMRIVGFLKSISGVPPGPGPTVGGWWKMVEGYLGQANLPPGPIHVNVVGEVDDVAASLGKVIVKDFVKTLLPVTLGPHHNALALIVASEGITMQEMCAGKCAQHGNMEINGKQQAYVLVGDPVKECPECAVPFVQEAHPVGPPAVPLKPPSGDIVADTMVLLLAGGLVDAVLNPYGDGFTAMVRGDEVDNSILCKGIFGRALIDPVTGGAFNANGINNQKFLLPAIMDPVTNICRTPA